MVRATLPMPAFQRVMIPCLEIPHRQGNPDPSFVSMGSSPSILIFPVWFFPATLTVTVWPIFNLLPSGRREMHARNHFPRLGQRQQHLWLQPGSHALSGFCLAETTTASKGARMDVSSSAFWFCCRRAWASASMDWLLPCAAWPDPALWWKRRCAHATPARDPDRACPLPLRHSSGLFQTGSPLPWPDRPCYPATAVSAPF